jgi:hypothetical protein
MMPIAALPTAFDGLFARHASALPIAFLRALAKRESNMNPHEAKDPAWGLLQVVPSVRLSYNERRGTSYTQQDLLDADVNVTIATDLLNRIVIAYDKHPSRNMKADWRNPEFVNLVVAGWNSGYSEAAGVGHVASYLEQRGIPVTHDNVFRYAKAAGATKHLQNPQKQAWQKSVTQLYFQQPDAAHVESSLLLWALVATVVGLALSRVW